MTKLSLLAASLAALAGACADDSMTDLPEQPTATTFKLRIENVAPWTVLKSAQHALRTDGTSGAIGPGRAFEIPFTAGKRQNLSFVAMFGQSNDWFFAPGPQGLALYDDDGNPRSGDVTAEISLWNAGTELDQEPAVGDATGPHQPTADFGAADPDPTVRELGQTVTLSNGSTFELPPITAMIRVTLVPGNDREFVLRIENVSTADTLVTSAGPSGVGISPVVWALHTAAGPFFTPGDADRAQGLERVAEAGNGGVLGANLRALSGPATPISPGVFVIHRDPEPLYALGLADLELGLERIAESGNPQPLHDALAANARLMELATVGLFDTPVDADKAGAAGPGAAYEVEVTGEPGDHVSFATMFGFSNDWFFATRPDGIALFDADGNPRVGDVTEDLALYDAGTEHDQELAIGADTGPQQPAPDTGALDPVRQVREVAPAAHGFPASAHLRITLEPQ